MIRDIFLFVSHNDGTSTSVPDPVIGGMTNSEDVEKVHKLIEDANVPLYFEYCSEKLPSGGVYSITILKNPSAYSRMADVRVK